MMEKLTSAVSTLQSTLIRDNESTSKSLIDLGASLTQTTMTAFNESTAVLRNRVALSEENVIARIQSVIDQRMQSIVDQVSKVFDAKLATAVNEIRSDMQLLLSRQVSAPPFQLQPPAYQPHQYYALPYPPPYYQPPQQTGYHTMGSSGIIYDVESTQQHKTSPAVNVGEDTREMPPESAKSAVKRPLAATSDPDKQRPSKKTRRDAEPMKEKSKKHKTPFKLSKEMKKAIWLAQHGQQSDSDDNTNDIESE